MHRRETSSDKKSRPMQRRASAMAPTTSLLTAFSSLHCLSMYIPAAFASSLCCVNASTTLHKVATRRKSAKRFQLAISGYISLRVVAFSLISMVANKLMCAKRSLSRKMNTVSNGKFQKLCGTVAADNSLSTCVSEGFFLGGEKW